MATQRAKNYSASATRFGRGRAPSSLQGSAVRIGTMEPTARRDTKLTIRLTPLEDARFRQAHARIAGGEPLGTYLASLMAAGLEATEEGPSIIGGGSERAESAIADLAAKAAEAERRLARIWELAEGVLERQEKLGKVAVAQAKFIRELADGCARRDAASEESTARIEAAVARLAAELGLRR